MKLPLVILTLIIYGMVNAQSNPADTTEHDPLIGKGRAAPAVRNEEMRKVTEAKDGEEKERAYLVLIAKFPPEQTGVDYLPYDHAREIVALGFARIDDVHKALQYVSLVEDRYRRGEAGARIALSLAVRGHVREAAQLYKTAIANAEEIMADSGGKSRPRNFMVVYVADCDRYADLLYKQKNYSEALHYAKIAHDSSGEIRAEVNAHYAEILIALGKDQEAFDKIDEAVRAGQVTESMRRELETLYKKVKGSNEGYEAYASQVTEQLAQRSLARLPSRMIDEQAPAFSLQDLKGNTVSLDDFKGKVVVVDFWATWCGPCKASFPMMQTMVDKYKDDSDVKFLFIHTWEREGNPVGMARSYIRSMKYNFEVLMDLKDEASGINPVVKSFAVTGIPTKFVIDKNGHIRFKLIGFSKNEAAAADELTEMIGLVGKQ